MSPDSLHYVGFSNLLLAVDPSALGHLRLVRRDGNNAFGKAFDKLTPYAHG